MEQKSIGSFIAALRKASGMTQKQLAEILCVSDKTISHWERGESAPDLSIIPIIADVFSVSCDELLRGEKNSLAQNEASAAEFSIKSEKQIKALLEISLSKHKRSCVIAVAVFLCALALSAGAYFALNSFMQSNTVSSALCALFLIISILITALSHGIFVSKLNKDEFDEEILLNFKKRCNLITTYTYFILLTVLACALFGFQNVFQSVDNLVINHSLLCFVLDFFFLVIIIILKHTGTLAKAERTQKEKGLFRLRIFAVLSALILIGAGVFAQIKAENLSHMSDQPIIFNSFEEFKEYMETDTPGAIEGTQRAKEMGLTADKNGYYEIENRPEMKFKWNNNSVLDFDIYYGSEVPNDENILTSVPASVDFSISSDNDGRQLYFEVYTSTSQKYASLSDTFGMLAYLYYPLVIFVCVLFYLTVSNRINGVKTRRKKKNKKS